jgi:hypothetical protein
MTPNSVSAEPAAGQIFLFFAAFGKEDAAKRDGERNTGFLLKLLG